MSLDELSGKLDSEKRDEILIFLMITSIIETRAMIQLLLDRDSKEDEELFKQHLSIWRGMKMEQLVQIKNELFSRFGKFPMEGLP